MAFTTIDDPAQYFNTVLFTGDIVDGDGTGHDQAVTGVGFQPNFLWHKCRSHANQHMIVDGVRGTGGSPTQMLILTSQDNAAEVNTNTNGAIESIDSDGFTVTSGNDSSSKSNNAGANGRTYVDWCWKEDATAGFDIVSYTGNATNRTISHNLSAVPHWILIKNLDSTSSSAEHWLVYHKGNGNTHAQLLNQTDAKIDDATYFQDTDPTSSVFSIGTADRCNKNSEDNIAYVWSEKQGYSKFGTFTGNNNADGIFVYTGFRPAWVMTKSSNQGGTNYDWVMFDNKRNINNPNDDFLDANNGGAEVTSGRNIIDFCSNGFKCRSSYGDLNSNYEYIYMAFAEAPFVNSNGVPANAR